MIQDTLTQLQHAAFEAELEKISSMLGSLSMIPKLKPPALIKPTVPPRLGFTPGVGAKVNPMKPSPPMNLSAGQPNSAWKSAAQPSAALKIKSPTGG